MLNTTDLSAYRLQSLDQLDALVERYGWEVYTSALENIFNALDALPIGGSFSLSGVPEAKRELAVKICCMYIQYKRAAIFSEDYTTITKIEVITLKAKKNEQRTLDDKAEEIS